jgi:hypothetical protein
MGKKIPEFPDELIDSPPSKFKYPLKTVVIAIEADINSLQLFFQRRHSMSYGSAKLAYAVRLIQTQASA